MWLTLGVSRSPATKGWRTWKSRWTVARGNPRSFARRSPASRGWCGAPRCPLAAATRLVYHLAHETTDSARHACDRRQPLAWCRGVSAAARERAEDGRGAETSRQSLYADDAG